jgi:transcriptional regulator with XRE-family HTH domain
MQRLGWLLREIRQRADMSQDEIARLAGASRSQVSRWENGQHEPSYRKIRRLADALHELDPSLDDLSGELVQAAGYDSAPLAEASAPAEDAASLDAELDRIERQLNLDLSSLPADLRRALLRHYQALDTRMSELERREAERQDRPAV